MNKLKIFISGSGYFGERVLRLCLSEGHTIVGVSAPVGDKYLGKASSSMGIEIIPAGSLNADNFPEGVDLGITAHSFDYVGKRTRYKPKYGWLGYHPSLLPRHRGRSSIEWAIRMNDPITGGTLFWLNAGIDRGNIAYQDWTWISPKISAMGPKDGARELWQTELQEIGLKLFKRALCDIERGVIISEPQRADVSTWEPSTKVNDIYRPDALMIEAPGSLNGAQCKTME